MSELDQWHLAHTKHLLSQEDPVTGSTGGAGLLSATVGISVTVLLVICLKACTRRLYCSVD